MIVVDVNIIAYLLIAGERTAEAQALYALDPDWVAPDLWRDEFLNILATYVRHGGAELEAAKQLWQIAVDLFGVKEQRADPLSTLELSTRFRVSAYDAQYLAVAAGLGARLLTEDRALRQSAPEHTTTPHEFLDSQRHTAQSTPNTPE
jgi:predicted nucleic acid-binding protein